MLGKLIGRLSYWGWRDGRRSDRRHVRSSEEQQWRRELRAEQDPYEPHLLDCTCRFCRAPMDWQLPCRTCLSYPCTCQSGAYGRR